MNLSLGSLLLFGAVAPWIPPLWRIAVVDLAVVAALAGIFALARWAFPKSAAVAYTTAKEAMSQPLFYVLMAIGVSLFAILPYIPYNTLGEDIKLFKDSGLTLIMVLSIILGAWTASVSVADEIDGRIALTLLSKPITRREFIVGKFFGVIAPVTILFLVLGTCFLVGVSFKCDYDAGEAAQMPPKSAECLEHVVQIAPGLALAFMEVVVMASIGVAISTRFQMIPNLIICTTIYLLGHLMPTLVHTASQNYEIPYFIAQLLATILPMLDTFNIYAAISQGNSVPLEYLGLAALYCLLYSSVAMLVALLLFEDRDLA